MKQLGAAQRGNEAGRLPGQDERQILYIIERLRRLPFCEHMPAERERRRDCCELYGSSPRLFIRGLNSSLLNYEMFSLYANRFFASKAQKK